jgi:hypothetical protein
MEGCKELQFKQHGIIEFVTADKIPPIDIHCHMQAVYGDKCVDISKFLRQRKVSISRMQ